MKRVEKNAGQIIDTICSKLDYERKDRIEDKHSLVIKAIKISHQIQLTLLQAIKYGFLNYTTSDQWEIVFRYPTEWLFDKEQVAKISQVAINDFMQLIRKLGDLYSTELPLNEPVVSMAGATGVSKRDAICISFTNELEKDCPTFLIQNIYVPFHIAHTAFPARAAVLKELKEGTLLYFLDYIFRKEKFWEGQFDAVVRTLQCKDVILLLPTGGGKSIAFQLASLLLPGRTIVIEPIISLIEDQLDNLASYGITRCVGITSLIAKAEERAAIINLFGQGEYLIAYIAPERLQTVEFRESLRSLTVHTPINMVVVDEAHCVSEWGHDFRTAYLNIGRISREYCESKKLIPPLIALTGTASRAVLKDVQRELQIEDFDAIITPKTFDRPELNFEVILCSSSEKFPRLKGYLGQMLPSLFQVPKSTLFQARGKDTYSGLVFCPWVNGEFGVVQVSQKIQNELGISNEYYSGKAPKYEGSNYKWAIQKRGIGKRFKHNRMPLLTCTKAFGMGIDKSNIRYTLHYGLPFSIESFYQEAGRAGRDRRKAYCCILVSNDDPERNKKLLDPSTPVEEIAKVVTGNRRKRKNDDDITRALFFHATSFRGVNVELKEIKKMLQDGLPDPWNKDTAIVSYDPKNRSDTEKCLHRLLLLGIIEDYTIDYTKRTFTVKTTGASKQDIINSYESYISSYLGSRSKKEVEKAYALIRKNRFNFVLEMARLLLEFIYNVIEKGRRRALYEMFLTATDKPDDSNIRKRILRYLEQTEHSNMIEALLSAPDSGLSEFTTILEDIWSPNKAAEIRGQVSRYLESYPDYPSLLMLRALTETYTRDADQEVVKQNFMAAVKSSVDNYVIEETEMFSFIARSIKQVYSRDKNMAAELCDEVFVMFPTISFNKFMVKELPESLVMGPALMLLRHMNEGCLALIN